MPLILLVLASALVGCAAPVPTVAPETPPAPAVSPEASPTAQRASPVPATTRQLVLVTTDAWDGTTAVLQRFERTESGWAQVGGPVPSVVGRSGLGWGIGLHSPAAARSGEPQKREGDGRAPAGVFRLTAAFGYAPGEATGLPYIPTDPDTECVDDAASSVYNTVRERTAAADWSSHEEMRRRDGLYRIGVVVAHNGAGVDEALVPAEGAPVVRGGGSCIFLHVWSGPASTTSGCTAMPDASLQTVLAWLDASADPVLVQLPHAAYDRLQEAWGLP